MRQPLHQPMDAVTRRDRPNAQDPPPVVAPSGRDRRRANPSHAAPTDRHVRKRSAPAHRPGSTGSAIGSRNCSATKTQADNRAANEKHAVDP